MLFLRNSCEKEQVFPSYRLGRNITMKKLKRTFCICFITLSVIFLAAIEFENQVHADDHFMEALAIIKFDPKVEAQNFLLPDLNGNQVSLADQHGKIVFLNFWATWCPPCRAEMPGLNKLVAEFADSDVVFIGFASDPAEELRRFLDGHRFEYRIVPQAGNIARLYGVAVFPTHVIIDKEGRVRYFLTGGSPERHDQLRPLIQSLL